MAEIRDETPRENPGRFLETADLPDVEAILAACGAALPPIPPPEVEPSGEAEAIEPEPEPGPTEPVGPPPRPRSRRKRTRLLAPLALIVSAALALIFRFSVDDWRLPWMERPASTVPVVESPATSIARGSVSPTNQTDAPKSDSPAPEPDEAPGAAEPFVVQVGPTEPVEPEPEPKLAIIARAPIETDRSDSAELVPHIEAMEDLEVDPAAILADLKAEAASIVGERRAIEGLKEAIRGQNAAEEAHRRTEQSAETHRSRLEFLAALEEVRAGEGDRLRAAATIARMTNEADPGKILERDQKGRAEKLALSRPLRLAWVGECRRMGVSEAAILQDIASALLQNRAARNGPHDPESALLAATDELLAVPVSDEPPPPAPIRPPNRPMMKPRPLHGGIQKAKTETTGSQYGVSRRRR